MTYIILKHPLGTNRVKSKTAELLNSQNCVSLIRAQQLISLTVTNSGSICQDLNQNKICSCYQVTTPWSPSPGPRTRRSASTTPPPQPSPPWATLPCWWVVSTSYLGSKDQLWQILSGSAGALVSQPFQALPLPGNRGFSTSLDSKLKERFQKGKVRRPRSPRGAQLKGEDLWWPSQPLSKVLRKGNSFVQFVSPLSQLSAQSALSTSGCQSFLLSECQASQPSEGQASLNSIIHSDALLVALVQSNNHLALHQLHHLLLLLLCLRVHPWLHHSDPHPPHKTPP